LNERYAEDAAHAYHLSIWATIERRALIEHIFHEGNIAAPRLVLTEGHLRIVAAQYLQVRPPRRDHYYVFAARADSCSSCVKFRSVMA
jgi:hypothetical protein